MDEKGITPQSDNVPVELLNKVKALVGERFDDYLIVVSSNGNIFSLYKNKTSAFGMASMVVQDINHDWWVNRSNKI